MITDTCDSCSDSYCDCDFHPCFVLMILIIEQLIYHTSSHILTVHLAITLFSPILTLPSTFTLILLILTSYPLILLSFTLYSLPLYTLQCILTHTSGVDENLAHHVSHLFTRDPLVIFDGMVELDDQTTTDHFENIQSTNWQTCRYDNSTCSIFVNVITYLASFNFVFFSMHIIIQILPDLFVFENFTLLSIHFQTLTKKNYPILQLPLSILELHYLHCQNDMICFQYI